MTNICEFCNPYFLLVELAYSNPSTGIEVKVLGMISYKVEIEMLYFVPKRLTRLYFKYKAVNIYVHIELQT
jgi:hypothetical protein